MKKETKQNIIKDQCGMTLVEVIIAVVIIGICALVLLTTFRSAYNLIMRGVDIAETGDTAFSEIESSAPAGIPSQLVFNADSTQVTVSGSYSVLTKDSEADAVNSVTVEHWLFIPEIEPPEAGE